MHDVDGPCCFITHKVSHTLDPLGNPVSYQGQSLAFDPEGRMTGFGTAETNTYTGDGLRAHKGFVGGVRVRGGR